jgi:hypothetical protein
VAERWDVPHEPGVLRAVGKRNGTVVVTTEVRTAGSPARLRLSVDRDTIRAGERDVAHVRVEVADRNGVRAQGLAPATLDIVVAAGEPLPRLSGSR